ncbi:hypothetical protein O181_097589 [Austropuccinia psidii MF-1]|uniref:Uncharacterized protein n=1 Tax=Austropuccinia psidii MF-1 TaxID=1389203 RepID=A0A9Q3J9K4_9BASI|nr:hypothetical protein [Austropuccinia psidii MF-1]
MAPKPHSGHKLPWTQKNHEVSPDSNQRVTNNPFDQITFPNVLDHITPGYQQVPYMALYTIFTNFHFKVNEDLYKNQIFNLEKEGTHPQGNFIGRIQGHQFIIPWAL